MWNKCTFNVMLNKKMLDKKRIKNNNKKPKHHQNSIKNKNVDVPCKSTILAPYSSETVSVMQNISWLS